MCVFSVASKWVPFLENNPVFWDALLTMLSLIIGVLAIVFSVKKVSDVIDERTLKARISASFGFYNHLLCYLKQLEFFMTDVQLKKVFQLLVAPKVRGGSFGGTVITIDEINATKPTYIELCRNFMWFLSSSENNVPPEGTKWEEWYKLQSILIEFLHKGVMIDTVYWFESDDKITDYNAEFESVKSGCKRIRVLVEDCLNKL